MKEKLPPNFLSKCLALPDKTPPAPPTDTATANAAALTKPQPKASPAPVAIAKEKPLPPDAVPSGERSHSAT